MRQIAQYFALAGALIMMAFEIQASPQTEGYAIPDAEFFRAAPSEQMDLKEALASGRWQQLEEESPLLCV